MSRQRRKTRSIRQRMWIMRTRTMQIGAGGLHEGEGIGEERRRAIGKDGGRLGNRDR